MAARIRHFNIRCTSTPWRGRSGWMTIKEARDFAMLISEEAYENDMRRYGSSRIHYADVINHEENTFVMTVAYQG